MRGMWRGTEQWSSGKVEVALEWFHVRCLFIPAFVLDLLSLDQMWWKRRPEMGYESTTQKAWEEYRVAPQFWHAVLLYSLSRVAWTQKLAEILRLPYCSIIVPRWNIHHRRRWTWAAQLVTVQDRWGVKGLRIHWVSVDIINQAKQLRFQELRTEETKEHYYHVEPERTTTEETTPKKPQEDRTLSELLSAGRKVRQLVSLSYKCTNSQRKLGVPSWEYGCMNTCLVRGPV